VIEAIENHGLDVWVYTDTGMVHPRREGTARRGASSGRVKFPPSVVRRLQVSSAVWRRLSASRRPRPRGEMRKGRQKAGGTHISAARSQALLTST